MEKRKYVTIQYLRGLAAILVLASHALLYPLPDGNLGYSRLGWLGVILFFVISGFIMVAVTGEGRFNPGEFLRRRFLRIVPMYWGATLIAAALALLAPQLFKTTVYDTGQLILSLLFVPFHNPVSHGIHPLYKLGWTLNYEIYFYIAFALLAFLGAGARVLWLTVVFAALTLAGALIRPDAAIPQFYMSFMPLAFCAGAWLGHATLRGQIAAVPKGAAQAIILIGLAGLALGFAWNRGNLNEDSVAFIGLLAFATALVLCAIRFEAAIPHVGLLETIGDASYSIYLVHIYEVAVLSGLAFRWLDPHDLTSDLGVAAASIVGGTIAGLVVYRFVEQPLMQLLRGRRKPRVAAVPAAAE